VRHALGLDKGQNIGMEGRQSVSRRSSSKNRHGAEGMKSAAPAEDQRGNKYEGRALTGF
jgi:hypothetical protein